MDYASFQWEILDNLFEGVYFVDRNRVITYWSSSTTELTGYDAKDVVGRTCCENIINYVDKWGHSLCDAGRCPAQQSMDDGEIRQMPVSYRHREGHMTPAWARFIPVRDGQGNICGVMEAFQDISPIEREREKARLLEKMALMDPVTRIANRMGATARLEARLNEFKRYGWPFGVLFCDVDKFKLVNDTYGHETGDLVLRAVAKTISANVRSSDFVSRWGGDEFLVILQNTNEENLIRIAEKVRRLMAQCRVSAESNGSRATVSVTASIGATLALSDDTMDSLLKRADELMYRDKKAGASRDSGRGGLGRCVE